MATAKTDKDRRIAPKIQRRATFKLRRPAKQTMVLTRHITTATGGKARWGSIKEWLEYESIEQNLRAAIKYGRGILRKRRLGTIVYIVGRGFTEPVAVYDFKWGHDNKPYMNWKQYTPVALYWQSRLERS